MKVLLTLLLWAILLALCWPLALLVLVLWPFFWLLSIPFRLVGATPRLEVARAFYDARVPPCTEGPRRAPVPSPFDPSGSPVVAPRKGDGGADGSANGAL